MGLRAEVVSTPVPARKELPRNFLLLIMQQYTLESWNLGIWEAWNLGVWNPEFQTPRFQISRIPGFQDSKMHKKSPMPQHRGFFYDDECLLPNAYY